jgi:protein-S-isoprenylcysteine O-methyltransferase Ste14
MLAAALLSANLLIAISGLTIIVLLVWRTPKEEQKLVDKFGDEYRKYTAVTGRFFPKLGS